MRIELHPAFNKSYRKRILHNSKLVQKTNQRLKLFQRDPTNLLLRDHSLSGSKKDYRAFCITGDIRIVYKKIKDGVRLYDIGTHNQVY